MTSSNLPRKPKTVFYVVLLVLYFALFENTCGGQKDNRAIVATLTERRRNFNKIPTDNLAAVLKNSKYNDMDSALIDVLETCLMANKTRPLLLAGEFDDFLRSQRKYFESRKVALIGDSGNSALESFVQTNNSIHQHSIYNAARYLHKLHYFAVFASSVPTLQASMRRIVESVWTNPEGFFVLYGTGKCRCDEAFGFLWTAWEFEYVNVLYLCRDRASELALYTYNPFSNVAPSPWEEVRRYEGRDEHPWVLLRRKYLSGKSMCDNLYFDKTSVVDGYTVRVSTVLLDPFLIIDGNGTQLADFHGENGKTMKSLLRKLNVTPVINVHHRTNVDALTTTNSSDVPAGLFTDIINGKADMIMNYRYLLPRWGIRYTYPHAQGGICVVTQNSGYVSELTKLLNFLSAELVACIVLINVSTIIVLSWGGRQEVVAAALNALRAFVCVSVAPPPRTTYGRMYLHTVMFTFVTINAIFQSHWSSILTLPVPKPNVEDIADLRKWDYTIYGPGPLRNVIGDSELHARIRVIAGKECKATVLRDENAACVLDCRRALYKLPEDLFHHSPPIHPLPEAYVTRPSWPLYPRVNQLIRNMAETGLINRWRWKDLRPYRQYHRKRQLFTSGSYRVLVVKRLEFIFYFLISGLLCATAVFFVELIVGRRHRLFHRKNRTAESASRRVSKVQREQATLPWIP